MKRRGFLVAGLLAGGAGVAAGGLLVGVRALGSDRVGGPDALMPQTGTVALNAWIRIGTDGRVSVVVVPVEMGQGVSTALPMIVAEELDMPLSLLRVEAPDTARRYGNRQVFTASTWFHPDNEDTWLARRLHALGLASGAVLGVQITGGSSSVREYFEPLRQAGAAARALLVAAAAARWDVSAADCSTSGGAVWHRGQRLAYGTLALEAARLPLPARGAAQEPARAHCAGHRGRAPGCARQDHRHGPLCRGHTPARHAVCGSARLPGAGRAADTR